MERSAIATAFLIGMAIGFACGWAYAVWRRSWRDVTEAKVKLSTLRKVAWRRTWPWSGWVAFVLVLALLAFGYAARQH